MSRTYNTPGSPGRRDRLANAMSDCCIYTPPGHMEECGWWTLCPAHEEVDDLLRTSNRFGAVLAAATRGDDIPERATARRTLLAAYSVVGASRLHEDLMVWCDPALVRRFLDALDLL